MKLNTVNVVEVVDGDIVGLTSFEDNEAGNKSAESHFESCMRENWGGDLNTDDALEFFSETLGDALNEGWWSDMEGSYTVSLVHSN